ncbi:MAG: bifunctional pyr operon transcriptional regulator/uracil phosphoribosyltransferase PyrR [Clostridiales bacterium]|nr:bifunctional pyr operon transcriptional regulator/uracil phosphoribosyltransferase PyrR [Clostridiales bacterium]
MEGDTLSRTISRIGYEIAERNRGVDNLCLIGILGKGPPLAGRIAERLEHMEGIRPPVGQVDTTPYRDDRAGGPAEDRSDIPFSLDGRRVVLVDDVMQTGRTVRAAIEALMARGRPAQVQLFVLVDRGHRELPIKADYVGKNLPTSRGERVLVRLREQGGDDTVVIVENTMEHTMEHTGGEPR